MVIEQIGVTGEITREVISEEDFDVSHARKVIEAILFAAGYPVTYAKIADALSTTPSVIKRVVNEFAEEYNDAQRGIMMLAFDDSCQLCTREKYGLYIREALGIKRGGNLSASSMEVLAIVSYNQPVTRSFVDLVRGVDSSYAMNSLVDKGLIEACGRLDAPGRPMLYGTTDKFLRVFGLNSVDELPEVELLRASDEQMEIMAPGEEIIEE